jgi:hypothetical protein
MKKCLLNELGDQNAKVRKRLAEARLDQTMLKEIFSKKW